MIPAAMRISVVVPTLNRPDSLRRCLAALHCQTYPNREVIVVDDGPSEATRQLVADEFAGFRYLSQPHRGPAAARNLGIAAASGEVIAFTDDDCCAPQDWLARLADGYGRYPALAGVGGGLTAPPEVLATNVFAQYERYLSERKYHAGDEEVLGGFECPAGGSANMSYTRASLEAVGGFDTRFPVAAGEDADLKLRITQTGRQLLYLPVWVHHLQPYTWPRFRRQCYLRGVGRNYFEQKHGAGRPGRLKILLRAARRLLTFPVDLAGGLGLRLALLKLADGLVTCQGQWVGR
jgi:glycosyltransferase involved in cell wall biosynthesis